jgi:hypothetical protein
MTVERALKNLKAIGQSGYDLCHSSAIIRQTFTGAFIRKGE